jgi:hypothetical protein
MRTALITALAVLALASPAYGARFTATPTGDVTIEWPSRVCDFTHTTNDVTLRYSPGPAVAVDDESDEPSAVPPEGVDMTASPDTGEPYVLDDTPLFPLSPWRVDYDADGSYTARYDVSCSPTDDETNEVTVDLVEPDARTLQRAERASQRAKARSTKSRARRRGLRR